MTSGLGPRPQRPRPKRRLDAVRRPQILATAVELVREQGLWNVRISDVAQRVGLSPTSIVYYFGTKDELFAQAISDADDAFYEPLLVELAALPSALERIARLIARSSTADWLLWMDLWAYARHHPETAVAQRGFHRRWRQTIEDIVRQGAGSGEWTVADPGGVGGRVGGGTDGLAVHMVLGDPDHTPAEYVAMSLAAISLELGCALSELERAAATCPPASPAPAN